jgi:hypothetical protein
VEVEPLVAGPEDDKSIPVQKNFPVLVRMMDWMVGSEESFVRWDLREVIISRVRELPLRGLLRVIVAEDESRVRRIRSEEDGAEEGVVEGEGGEDVIVIVEVVGVSVTGFWRLADMAAPARDSFFLFKVFEIHSPISTKASKSTPVLTPISWKLKLVPHQDPLSGA